MNSPLLQLMGMQIKEFFREPEILFWSFLFPIAIAGVLGIAFVNQGEPETTVAVIHTEDSANLDALVSSLQDTSSLQLVSMTQEEAELAMKRGQLAVYVIKDKMSPIWKAYFDPKNSEANLTYFKLKSSLLENREQPLIEASYITTPGSRYIDFLIPGLIALGIMNSCVWGIGWALIEFRIKKLMRRMVATPMKRSTFLLSYVLTRSILALLEASIVFLFAYLVFDVRISGSMLAALLTFVAGLIAFAGIAILISSRAQHTQVGNGLINAVVLPMTILSGVFFSYQNFPEWAIHIIQFLPLSLLTDALRAIFLEAATLHEIGWKILMLAGFGFGFFLVGLRIYKWY